MRIKDCPPCKEFVDILADSSITRDAITFVAACQDKSIKDVVVSMVGEYHHNEHNPKLYATWREIGRNETASSAS